jgi:hypothetical protein
MDLTTEAGREASKKILRAWKNANAGLLEMARLQDPGADATAELVDLALTFAREVLRIEGEATASTTDEVRTCGELLSIVARLPPETGVLVDTSSPHDDRPLISEAPTAGPHLMAMDSHSGWVYAAGRAGGTGVAGTCLVIRP